MLLDDDGNVIEVVVGIDNEETTNDETSTKENEDNNTKENNDENEEK